MFKCEILKHDIGDPTYFDQERLTRETFKKTSQYYALILWQYHDDTISQQDGDPPHYAIPEHQFAQQNFQNC